MPFHPKQTRQKKKSVYKTLYISQELVDAVDKLAAESETSFNNVIISMVEYCIAETEKEEK